MAEPNTNKQKPPKPKPPKPQLGAKKSQLMVPGLGEPFESQPSTTPAAQNLTAKPRPPLSRTASPIPDLSNRPSSLPATPSFNATPAPAPSHPRGLSPVPPLNTDVTANVPDSSPLVSIGSTSFEWVPPTDSEVEAALPPPLPSRTNTRTFNAPMALQPPAKHDNIPTKTISAVNLSHTVPSCEVKLPKQDISYVCRSQTSTVVATSKTLTLLGEVLTPLWELEIAGVVCCALHNNYLWYGRSTGNIGCVDFEAGVIVFESRAAHNGNVVGLWSDEAQDKVLSLGSDGKLMIWGLTSDSPRTMRTVLTPVSSSLYLDGKLFLTTKNLLYVYSPFGSVFQLTARPVQWPSKSSSSTRNDFSCMTTDGVHLFCGHNDGTVSAFDLQTYNPIYSALTGMYAITSIGVVGTHWWLGLSSGKIIIVDFEKFELVRDWKAGNIAVRALVAIEDDVICSITDQCLLWTIRDDPDSGSARPPSRTSSVSLQVFSWNVDSRHPETMAPELIRSNCSESDVVVFGLQEVVELSNKTKTAKNFASGGDQTDLKEYGQWKKYLARSLGSDYDFVFDKALVGLYVILFARPDVHISRLGATLVKTGMGGLHGNKGGIIVHLNIDDSAICLINCHLAAGHTEIIQRNRDAAQILATPTRGSMRATDFDSCFFFGDTNYRINTAREAAVKYIKDCNWEKLESLDQLNGQKRKNPGFCLSCFQEPPLKFPPTYKFDRNSDTYDSSSKKRVPAWCDRILYKDHSAAVKSYRSVQTHYSDHRPVTGIFKLKIKTY